MVALTLILNVIVTTVRNSFLPYLGLQGAKALEAF